DGDVDHRVAGGDAVLDGFADALLYRGDVLPWDAALGDLVLEDESRSLLPRANHDLGVPVLALAAGLADEPPYTLALPAHRLLVGDLRLALVRVDAELAQQAVDDDLEVELAHALDDRLARLLVGVHLEGRVLFRQPLQRHAELLLVGLRLGLDGDRDHRLGERDRLEQDRMRFVTERVARRRHLQPDGRCDVTGEHFVDVLAPDCMHAQDPTDALALSGRRVHDGRARLEAT